MAFTLYYVNANYQPQHQHNGVVGYGQVCDTLEDAQREAIRMMTNLKIDSVDITPKVYG